MVTDMIRLCKQMLLAALLGGLVSNAAAQNDARSRGTGLPVPRFVSLKSDNVNVRRGPGREYDVAFTFVRADLPVEITAEFATWRKIRDSEGDEGWVLHSLLSGERTALVTPWASEGQFPVRTVAGEKGDVVAYLLPRVVANVSECTGDWCHVSGKGFEGWIQQDQLWGVYPNEKFEE
jgi:SH3-like domain-containing protein